MPSPHGASGHEAELRRFEDLMLRLHARAALGSRALGVPDWDWRLASMGREWLAAHPEVVGARGAARRETGDPPRDVYLATQVYDIGGHTALIGDMVRALDPASRPGGSLGAHSYLVVTNLYSQNPVAVSEALQARLSLPRDHIAILDGTSRAGCLDQLFTALIGLEPDRLFLFHHSHDPLAAVIAQPAIAPRQFLVHHADSVPSFAMHLPGVRIIDLFPNAAAMTRLLGRRPALLLLTAEDPGPRPHGFLTRGCLVTASCGSAHKFETPYLYSYADTVSEILKATGGWHVHIGPLGTEARLHLDRALDRARVPHDRFVHVASAASVARALWEHQCDVLVASFPIDGARTRIEGLASGTPYLRHSTSPDPSSDGLVWREWADLSATLVRLSHPAILEEQSVLMRAEYDRTHHPDVFARTLRQIVEGGDGVEVADGERRRDHARDALVRSLTSALLHETHVADAVESAHEGLAYLRGQLETIQDQVSAARDLQADQQRQVDAIAADRQRGRLRRWLSKM